MSSPSTPASMGSIGSIALIGSLTFFWGANWPFMKIALSEIPVWWFRTICLFVGGSGLMLIAWISGQSLRVPRAEIPALLFCALFNVIGWHLFTGYGVSMIPAGRAVIIAYTMPVWASIFSCYLLDEHFSLNKTIALALGLCGLAVLIGPDFVELGSAPLGVILMLGAAISWAAGSVAFKRPEWSVSVSVLVAWQLLFGAVPLLIGAILIEDPFNVTTVSSSGLYALGYVVVFPMIFCQWAYFKSVRIFPVSFAAISTMGIPLVGTYASALILDESVGVSELIALVLICSALAAVLFPSAFNKT